MNFELDFSLTNLSNDPDKITPSEIRSVIEDVDSNVIWMQDYPANEHYHLECGYSNKKRILIIILYIPRDKRVILDVKVADKKEIKQYYCQK